MSTLKRLRLSGILSGALLLLTFQGFCQYPHAEKGILEPLKKMADSLFAISAPVVAPGKVVAILDSGITAPPACKISLAADGGKVMNAKAIYAQYKAAVGLVAMCSKPNPLHNAELNQATAFAITADGVCVTNYHVIYAYAHARTLYDKGVFLVRMQNGKVYPLKAVLAFSAQDDIAIIKLDGGTDVFPFLQFSASDPEIGEDIYVIGNAQTQLYSITSGIISDKYNETIGLPGGSGIADRNLLSITADFAVGASGSPLLDSKGCIAGLVSSTHVIEQQNTGHPQTQMVIKNAIPVSSIKKLLNVH